MKSTRLISAFLLILFLFSGCASAPEIEPSESTADVSDSVTVTDTTTAVLQTQEASEQTTVPMSVTATEATTAVQTETSAVTSPVPTSEAVTATARVSAADPESTVRQTETTKKSVWQLFTNPSQADKTSDKSESSKKNNKNTVCTVTITCTTIKQNRSMLKKGKESFVPKSGVILDNAEVTFESGDTAFDVIQKACRENVCTDNCKYCQKSGIQLEYNYTPAFGTYYVEGIHQLYEKDCGNMSGWMFSVNGTFPTEGSSSYTVKPDDSIIFAYTCDMGDDIGNSY